MLPAALTRLMRKLRGLGLDTAILREGAPQRELVETAEREDRSPMETLLWLSDKIWKEWQNMTNCTDYICLLNIWSQRWDSWEQKASFGPCESLRFKKYINIYCTVIICNHNYNILQLIIHNPLVACWVTTMPVAYSSAGLFFTTTPRTCYRHACPIVRTCSAVHPQMNSWGRLSRPIVAWFQQTSEQFHF